MTNSTRDKVVLITGSRDGIGKETGELFARKSYKVIFSGKKLGDCKNTVEKLSAEGLKVSEAQIDLSDISKLKESVNNALSIWGKLAVSLYLSINILNSLNVSSLSKFKI